MDKMFFIEGLPGTGKTTVSEWLKIYLEEKGMKVKCLLEDDLQIPTNFFHMASVPEDKFYMLSAEHPAIKDIAVKIKGYFFISIDQAPKGLHGILSEYDIGNEFNLHFTVEAYMTQTLLYIEQKFQKLNETDGIIIVDSGFLQNPINEIFFRKGTTGQAKEYISAIVKLLKPYDFLCIYLDRGDADLSVACAKTLKGEFWYNRVMELIEKIGLPDHFQNRYSTEIDMIHSRIFPCITCRVIDTDWSMTKELLGRL